MLIAKEVLEYNDGPVVVYCEDGDKKFIAVLVDEKKLKYVLYTVQNKAEYEESVTWIDFALAHRNIKRVRHEQIDWEESLENFDVYTHSLEV